MSQGEVRPSGLPKATYVMDKRIEDYVLAQMGVTVGHQGFDNNILMIEAFMKILPQAIYAQSIGMFDNLFTRRKSSVEINQVYIDRISQLWRKGLHCLVFRDPDAQHIIKARVVAYKSKDVNVQIRGRTYSNPWEIMHLCFNCGKNSLVGFMGDQDFTVDQTVCELVCKECKLHEFVEVEVKPSIKDMIPLRPRSYNPVWVQVSANILVRYAYEGIDLMALSSAEGGCYYPLGGVEVPWFNNFEEILNSPDYTAFPSQKYFDDTFNIIFDEWIFFYNRLLLQMHQMVTEKNQLIQTVTSKERQKMQHA